MKQRIYAPDGLNLRKVNDSGQCFRWKELPSGEWLIPSAGHMVYARQTAPDEIELSCTEEEFRDFWRAYFDLDTDYGEAVKMIDPSDTFLQSAAAAGHGIRILRQDAWETLITFIISQRKNIPAIRTCVDKLCRAAGYPVFADRGGNEIFGFPSPGDILAADADGRLESCSLGYRLPYIRETAEAVQEDNGWQTTLSEMSDEDLLEKLMSYKGVGVKVAKCAMLFGFHRLDQFPVDVWIHRALEQEYPDGFDFERYSPYGGVIQQYIFAYYREMNSDRAGGAGSGKQKRSDKLNSVGFKEKRNSVGPKEKRNSAGSKEKRNSVGPKEKLNNVGSRKERKSQMSEKKPEPKFQLKRLDRELAYQGHLLSFYRDTVELPDGKKEKWDFISHPTGGACVVAVLPDGKILMERQYRPSVNSETLELPAGAKSSPDEDPKKTAKRELEEETGYTCGRLIFLAEVYSAPSWCNEHTHIYLARNIRPAHGQELDEAEEIRLESYTLKQLLKMIRRGEIVDAKTVAGINAYAVWLAEHRGD
ncbi:MAG: DNA glycosylase [Eubacteriales bacterium]